MKARLLMVVVILASLFAAQVVFADGGARQRCAASRISRAAAEGLVRFRPGDEVIEARSQRRGWLVAL